MMCKLVFNVDEPLDRNAHMRAIKATDAYLLIHAMSNQFITWNDDYENNEANGVEQTLSLDDIAQHFHDLMDRYGIDMNHLD